MQASTTASDEASSLPEFVPLRSGLVLRPRDDKLHFVLEDTNTGKFYRLGSNEARFMAALLENGSPTQAYQHCVAEGSQTGLSLAKSVELCEWLMGNGLVESDTAPPEASPTANPFAVNPLTAAFFWKVPLVNPDRWLTVLVQYFGWLVSPQAMILGLGLLLLAIIQTAAQSTEFFASYENLVSSWRWVTLALGWCVLKVIHETAHGAVCRRYGGEVREAGLAMILLVPIAYVNVTSSWRFESRWQRLHVTLAGISAELFVAAVALLAWHQLDSVPLQQAAADIVMLASISSLLFNLNPLLKFDGYFALADATGVDNLYSYGQRYARYVGARYLLGLDSRPPKLPGAHPAWIRLYGISAALYRVVTVSGLLVAAAALFQGGGIVIAILGAFSFVLAPLTMLTKHLRKLKAEGELSYPRMMLRLTCVASFAVAPLWIIPANWSWTAPAVVQYDPPATIRSRSAGFVETIHVGDGESVVKGQPIVTLVNEDLLLELSDLQKQLAQVEQEILSAQWRSESSELSDATSRAIALRAHVQDVQQQVTDLIVTATADGTAVSPYLTLRLGDYIDEGEELLVIGNERSKRLKVSFSQLDAKRSEDWTGQPLKIIIDGMPCFAAPLTRIETRATSASSDDSLLAINGGSLPAIQESVDKFVLCEPRIDGYIHLTAGQSEKLRTGQRAFVSLGLSNGTLGQTISNAIQRRIAAIWRRQPSTEASILVAASLPIQHRAILGEYLETASP